VADAWRRWLELLAREAEHARAAGELPADTDPGDIAFQLSAIASAASTGYLLSDREDVFVRARRLMGRLLGAEIA
jgi:hypothetical protein